MNGLMVKRGGINFPLIIFVGLLSIFVGGLLGLGLWAPGGAFVLLLCLVFVIVFTPLSNSYRVGSQGIFWTGFVLTFATAFFDLISPIQTSGLMEIWLIFLAPLLLFRWVYFINTSALAKVLCITFGLSFFLGLLSAFLNHVPAKAVLYQTAYNLKLPLMLALGLKVGWTSFGEKWVARSAILIAFCIAAWLVLEISAPGLYRSIAINLKELSYTPNPLLKGLMRRLSGPFVHSSELAYFSALFLLFFVVRDLGKIGSKALNWILGSVFAVFLILSGQQQETAAAFVAVAALYFLFKTRAAFSTGLLACMVASVLLVLMLFALGDEQLAKLGAEWGILPATHALSSARPVLFRDAFELANGSFPLGTGLGSFGGIGAKLFDRHVYELLGYHRYWWYRQDLFLLDTYWPNFIAETGWIASLALFSAISGLVLYSFNQAWRATDRLEKRTWSIAFGSQFVAVSISLTSPIYSDPNMVAFPFLFFGMAFTLSQQAKKRSGFQVDSAIPSIKRDAK